jgi:hypothetical protein
MALVGSIRAIDPVSIQLAGPHFREVAMPNHVCLFGKLNPKILPSARTVKEAKLYFLRVLGVQREVDAFPVPS